MLYEEWLAQVPDEFKKDPIWQFRAYPKALLLFDLMWEDSEKLLRDVRGREMVKQLVRSAGSITANMDEGFGRGVDRGSICSFCATLLALRGKCEADTTNHASSCPQI
jgi:hypothetical protein